MPLIQASGTGPGIGDVLAAEHDGAGAVGGRAGLGVADRVPQHHRVLDGVEGDVVLVEVGVGVLERVLPVLEHHEHPDVVGRLRAAHVGADVRREVAAGAGVQRRRERDRQRERPHRLALGLLLEADGEHPLVDAGLHELAGHDGGRAADAARGVHPEQRLAGRAERVGQVAAPASSRPRRSRGPCRSRRRRCRPRSSRRRRARARRPPARARPSTRRPGWTGAWSGRSRRPRPGPCPSGVSLQDAHQVLLQARSRRGVGDAAVVARRR